MSAVRFEFDLDRSLVIDPLALTEIVSSRTFLAGHWLEKTKHKLFSEPEVKKWFLPVDCSYWNLQVFTTVEARTVIPEHQHDEPVLRHVLSGSMELNGEHLEAGDWVVVPANYRYGIQTRDGYTILSAYHDNCAECQWHALSKLPLGKLD